MSEPRGAAWLVLLAAGVLEIVFAVALKLSDGFARLGLALLAVAAAVGSFGLLALALRDLPVGTAYAVWTGIGVVGVPVAGALALGEAAGPARLGLLAVLVAAIVGLRLVS